MTENLWPLQAYVVVMSYFKEDAKEELDTLYEFVCDAHNEKAFIEDIEKQIAAIESILSNMRDVQKKMLLAYDVYAEEEKEPLP